MNNVGEILTKPFPREQLEKRQGRGGMTLTYIPWTRMFDRMDEAFGAGGWSFVADKVWKEDDFILCSGHVLLPNGHQMSATDGALISRFTSGPNKGQPVDLGDDYKTAETNCAAKCLQRLGIGRYLSDPQRRNETPQKEAPAPKPQVDPENVELARIKNRVRYLISLSNNGIRERENFEAFCKHVTGTDIDTMTLAQWKKVAKELEEYVNSLEI